MNELVGVVLLSTIGATAASVGAIVYGRRTSRLIPARYIVGTYGIFIFFALVITLVPEALLGGLLAAIVGIDAVMWYVTRRRTTSESRNAVERPEFWFIAGTATLILAVGTILVSLR